MCNKTMLHCIAMIVAISFFEIGYGSFTAEEGPFEIIVHNTTDCLMKQQQPWFRTNITTFTSHGHSLLRGTVVTTRDCKNVKFRVRLYFIEKNQHVNAFEIKNQNCRNFIVKLVLMTIGLSYDDTRCTMKPAAIEFNNLDLDAVVHSVTQSLWYGNVSVRWEIAVGSTELMCLDISITSAKLSAKKT